MEEKTANDLSAKGQQTVDSAYERMKDNDNYIYQMIEECQGMENACRGICTADENLMWNVFG